jgi:protein-glutamine gamma-glutamyltransferase
MPPTGRIREWAAGASVMAQLAATAAGMLPWWALPLTVGLTLVVARPQPQDERRAPILRNLAVTAVGLFAVLIAFRTVAAGRVGANPLTTLRSLTEALVVLSLIMAPASRTPREYRVWLTVTTGVLVAAAAGGHSTSSRALSTTSWIVLLLAMARVQSAALVDGGAVIAKRTAGPGTRVTVAADRPTTGAVPVVAALLAGVVVFFALPSGLGGGDLAKRVVHRVDSANQAQAATRATAGVDTYGYGALSLLIRGDLPTTPLLRVPAASPTLWRGTFFATYTGTSWVADDHPFTLDPGSTTVPPSTEDPVPAGATHTYTAQRLGMPGGALIWAPGVPERITTPTPTRNTIIRSPANVRMTAAAPLPSSSSYTVTTAVATTDAARLTAAAGNDVAGTKWTQVPSELPSRVGALARDVTAGATSRFAEVSDVELYLRSHETYLLNSPVPGPGQDAVDDFLFRDHVGFCEQFASAAAVMLRTLGVPTRLVSGLAGGHQQGRTRLLTGSDAHAWIEVYYPGIGWSPSDPTAGVALAPAPPEHESAVTRIVDRITGALPGGRFALAIIALVLVVAGGTAGRGRIGRRRRTPTAPARIRIGPVLATFLRVTGRARAPAARLPNETAREYVDRVAPPGRLDDAVLVLEQECYGATPPDAAEAHRAIDAFATFDAADRS